MLSTIVPTTRTKILSNKRRQEHQAGVEFAGSTNLAIKSNQLDTILCCDFMDLVEVKLIPHFSDYDTNQLETLWYSMGDIQRMKHEFCLWKSTKSGREHHGLYNQQS